MKYITISPYTDPGFRNQIISWCEYSFGQGGVGEDWLVDGNRLIFWEDSYYVLFSLRWLD